MKQGHVSQEGAVQLEKHEPHTPKKCTCSCISDSGGPSAVRNLYLYFNPPTFSMLVALLYILTLISRIARFQHLHCGRLKPLKSAKALFGNGILSLCLTYSFKQRFMFLKFDLRSVWFLKRGKVGFYRSIL